MKMNNVDNEKDSSILSDGMIDDDRIQESRSIHVDNRYNEIIFVISIVFQWTIVSNSRVEWKNQHQKQTENNDDQQ